MSESDPPKNHDEFSHIDLAFTRQSPYGTIAEPTYSGALSFMRRAYQKTLDGVDIAVLGVPFDLSVTNRPGARFGPRAIREASAQLSWGKAWGWNSDPFEQLNVIDYGDCLFDPGEPTSIPGTIEATVHHILQQDAACLCLGGDHFTSYPSLKAHYAKHGQMALIHFDAHCDTWRDKKGRVDHGTMFFHAMQEGLIDPTHSAQVGIRTFNSETHGFNIYSAEWVEEQGAKATIDAIRACVKDKPVYLTFDIDCLDPAFAPGTGTPVAGGLTTSRALSILRGLSGINIVGMDVVEVAPAYDNAQVTALAAATVALNLICLYANKQG